MHKAISLLTYIATKYYIRERERERERGGETGKRNTEKEKHEEWKLMVTISLWPQVAICFRPPEVSPFSDHNSDMRRRKCFLPAKARLSINCLWLVVYTVLYLCFIPILFKNIPILNIDIILYIINIYWLLKIKREVKIEKKRSRRRRRMHQRRRSCKWRRWAPRESVIFECGKPLRLFVAI